MRKACLVDGREFEAKRAAAKYCSERCRKQAQRRPKASGVVSLAEARADSRDGGLTAATRGELEQAGRLESALGQAALFLATRIDTVGLVDTGAGVSALVKEHRTALEAAVRGADKADDALDAIRGSAALKLIRGAG